MESNDWSPYRRDDEEDACKFSSSAFASGWVSSYFSELPLSIRDSLPSLKVNPLLPLDLKHFLFACADSQNFSEISAVYNYEREWDFGVRSALIAEARVKNVLIQPSEAVAYIEKLGENLPSGNVHTSTHRSFHVTCGSIVDLMTRACELSPRDNWFRADPTTEIRSPSLAHYLDANAFFARASASFANDRDNGKRDGVSSENERFSQKRYIDLDADDTVTIASSFSPLRTTPYAINLDFERDAVPKRTICSVSFWTPRGGSR